jgi:hypothetical protein
MEEVDIFRYYAFGYDYCLLTDLQGNYWIKGKDSLISRIRTFLTQLDNLNLTVTKKIAIELNDILLEAKNKAEGDKVDNATALKVKAIIVKLDPTLDAELQLKKAYILTPKRYSLDNLLATPENLFAKNVFTQLTPFARLDLNEGLKCIAFNRPTAAAFHILRATEEMIKQLYLTIIKQKRIKHPTWFPMTEALRNKKQGPLKGELLGHLNMIRENFRNPTSHPEKVYDMDEAQDLLNNCITAINNLVKEIDLRNKP